MSTSVVEKTAEKMDDTAKKTVDVVEGHFGKARQLVKEGEEFADELYDTSARQIQRHPAESVTMMFFVGFGAGVVASWLLRRK
mgnify:CR=1 FL=1|jgi:transcriptional regulator